MKVCVFIYGFPHRKSAEGLNWLCAHGFRPELAVAAPKVDLVRPQALIPMGDQGYEVDPVQEAAKLGIPVVTCPHNECREHLMGKDFVLGIVLGARILSPEIITEFKTGILNIHPGILPANRGLCTIERAVVSSWPQGCAAHLIDNRVDRGWMIKQRIVPVFRGDTWHSLRTRIERCGRDLMIKALNILLSGEHNFEAVDKGYLGSYFSKEEQEIAIRKFETYKRVWGVDEDY